MNPIIKFFHEFLNPHCQHCLQIINAEREQAFLKEEIEITTKEQDKRCRACESLERQLAVANEQIIKLTDRITNVNQTAIPANNEAQPKVVHRGPIPFSLIRQQLETEARRAAAAAQNIPKSDEQLSQSNESNKVEEPLTPLEDMVINAADTRTNATGTKQ